MSSRCIITCTFVDLRFKVFHSPVLISDRHAGAPVDFESLEISGNTSDENMLRSAILSVQRNGIALKGTQYVNVGRQCRIIGEKNYIPVISF